mgnify:CR=1 FL=1
MNSNRIVFFLLFFFTGLVILSAQEEGLYGSEAPEDKAFIRVINTSGNSISNLAIGALIFKGLSPEELTAYRPLSPGIYIIRTGGQQTDLTCSANEYYTIQLSSSGPKIFSDVRQEDYLRSQLVLYNLSELQTVSLKTRDGNTTVINSVGAGASSQITVNPIDAELSLFSKGEKVSDMKMVDLESGQSYSIFILGKADKNVILIKQAEVKID